MPYTGGFPNPAVRSVRGRYDFSVDGGATSLAAFNTVSGGDAGDWASSVSNDAMDAFSSSGVANTACVEAITPRARKRGTSAGSGTSRCSMRCRRRRDTFPRIQRNRATIFD